MKNIFYPLLFSLILTSPAFAHKVQVADDVGATLHIEPNDNPRAGEVAEVWFALTRKGGKVIPLGECNCQLAVYAQPHKPGATALLQPSLKAIAAEKYRGIPGADIIFPQPGAYLLQLNGKPGKDGDFKPFELKFAVTVAAGSSQVNSGAVKSPSPGLAVQSANVKSDNSRFSPTILVVALILAIATILVISFRWRKRN
ncbi:hypothetical protein [Calothrix sp. UHCC 0171]|uniref:hypothetical protein n=1 Tax=Calothrix sp. UHCC 0171 TaxID=3110245 RepID=UPI002B1F002D|nr:hypothetical protein [Calothrix sp. UHCC 0171]MEA5572176.1 hypothetical protein [Calothrix sp. UHCC 0171]